MPKKKKIRGGWAGLVSWNNRLSHRDRKAFPETLMSHDMILAVYIISFDVGCLSLSSVGYIILKSLLGWGGGGGVRGWYLINPSLGIMALMIYLMIHFEAQIYVPGVCVICEK